MTGSSSPLAPKQVTTNNSIDDTVVSLFATDASSLTVPNAGATSNGTSTSSGIAEQSGHRRRRRSRLTPGAATRTAAAWATETVALRPLLPQSRSPIPSAGFSATRRQIGSLASISARGTRFGRHLPVDTLHWTPLGTAKAGSGANQITQSVFSTTATVTSYVFSFNGKQQLPEHQLCTPLRAPS